jgi:hypothetical protein
MLLLTYPVFADICGLIGKINMIQDSFTTKWLKEKLLSMWGERSTIYHSSDKVLQTLKYLGAIKNTKVGVYEICTYQVTDKDKIKVLLITLLRLNKKAYYEVSELSGQPLFFPFNYDVTLELLSEAKEINVSNFGGKLVVSAKDNTC